MSEIKYGLISEWDVSVIERTIDLIIASYPTDIIQVTEVGVYGGDTGKGIKEYINSKERQSFLTGVDNNRDGEKLRYSYDRLIIGDSFKVADQIVNKSQHLIIIDACHCFGCVLEDYNAYVPKIKIGGFVAFHDAGKHIQKFKDYQHGDPLNEDSYISVRKALTKIGLFEPNNPLGLNLHGVFDEGDENNPAGGFAVFRKM